jgi:hypothetical protein
MSKIKRAGLLYDERGKVRVGRNDDVVYYNIIYHCLGGLCHEKSLSRVVDRLFPPQSTAPGNCCTPF